MKKYSNLFKRTQALVLVLAIVFSTLNLGLWLTISADDKPTVSKTEGEIVAENYNLTDAEKKLLSSGLLAGSTLEYTVPADEDDLISVDINSKTITADYYDEWTPVSATIEAGEEVKENVTLTDGKGTYEYDGDAFSVKVTYELKAEVDEETQKTLLSAPALLKQGIANLDAVSAQSGNLYILEQAMPELVNLAETDIAIGTTGMTAGLSAEGKAAIGTLDKQMSANGGKLNLSVMVAEYDAGSKTAYLMAQGTEMQDEVEDLVANLTVISNALDVLSENVDTFVSYGLIDADTGKQIKTLSGVAGNLKSALTAVSEDPWAAAEAGTSLVSDEINNIGYSALDVYVAALTETTTVETINNPLVVDTVAVQFNMSMYDVTVQVILKTVDGTYEATPVKVTFKEGTESGAIEGASTAVQYNAWDAWSEEGLCDQEHYSSTIAGVPDILTEDVVVTITIEPNNYTVTYAYNNTTESLPYGSKVTLEKCGEKGKVYDYSVNGTYVPEGETIVVTGDVTIDRAEGKPYTNTDLYSVVADNFGDAVAKDILKSGALYGNEAINYRKPDPADAESLLKLENGMLTAVEFYSADYAGLYWQPYVYGSEGDISNYFGAECTAQWIKNSVKVQYVLAFLNFGQEKAQEILDLAKQLKEDAAEQKSAMDSLASMEDTLKMLDKTKLGALNGVIDVTDFTPGDGTDTDAENLALRAELKSVVSQIIANNVDSNNYLKIYNIVVNYKAEGLKYYYENYEEIKNEVNLLASYMTELMDNEEALRIMCSAAGYPEYADKISDVEGKLNDYNARLSAPNAAINVKSENLGKLVNALTAEGETSCTASGAPYILSDVLTATDSSQILIQVMIETPKGSATVTTEAMDRGAVATKEIVDDLKAKVEAKVEELLGDNVAYYTLATEGDLDALVGTELFAKTNIYNTYSYNEYKVVIEGEEDQIVTIDDLEINLPKHSDLGWRYEYTVDGVSEIKSSTYTFTAAQLDSLFANGTYTITRVAIDEAREKLDQLTSDDSWAVITDSANKVTGLIADVDGNKNGVMDFAMSLINSGYTYIALNGEPLLYMNDEDTLEISLQTLINALLNDNTFGSKTLINLGNNGKGKLTSSTISLGNSADEIFYEDLDFTFNLKSVPTQMGTVAKALTAVKNYMTFQSKDGVLSVDLNLPEKVYEVYLTTLLVTKTIDMTDINAINNEIAFMFLYDYIDMVINSDATTTTYTNTLAMLGQDYDLTGYEQYYQMLKKAFTAEGVAVNTTDSDGIFDVSISANGKTAIDSLIGLIGMDVSAYDTYLGMVKEYKNDGSALTATVVATLDDTYTDYEALVLDINATGNSTVQTLANKFDYTTNLPARVGTIANQAVVILMDDVDGDLNFKGTTLLDLNGYTVNGSVSAANGTVIIIDSSLAENAEDMGSVTGTISGNVTIIAGKYNADVTAFLKEGYVQKNGVVSNEYYTIVMDENGNLTVKLDAAVLNAKELPDVQTMVIDLVTELVLDGYTMNSLSIDGNQVYAITLDDIVNMLTGTNRLDNAVKQVVGMVNSPEIANLINTVLDDLTDFDALKVAIENDEAALSYSYVTGAWDIAFEHITDGDYLTVNLTTDLDESEKTINFVIVGSDEDKQHVADLMGALDETTKIDIEVSLDHGFTDESDPKNLIGNAGLVADVAFDFSDPDYTIMFCLLLAEGSDVATKAAIIEGINTYYESGSFDELQATFNALTTKQIVSAVKNFSKKNANFEGLVGAYNLAGLNTTSAEEIRQLEAYYDAVCLVAKVVSKLANELDITGGSRLMATFIKEDPDVYGTKLPKSLSKTYSRELVAGYSVTLNAKVEGDLSVTIFVNDAKAPEYVSDFVLSVKDSVLSYVVTDGMIIIDAAAAGLTKAEFEENLNVNLALYTDNTDWQTFAYGDDAELICTGTVVTATAHNDDTNETDEVTYTIVILGDVNKNGLNDAGDASLIANYLVKMDDSDLDNLQAIAADISRNGRIDIGDSVFVLNKCNETGKYTTHLKADEQE